MPILPNLTDVRAPTKWISNLLATRRSRCSLSKLVHIDILTKFDYIKFTYDYDLLDTTLSYVSKFYGRQIKLDLRFMHGWFSAHAELGKKNSVLGRLRCVSALEISFSLHVDFTEVPIGLFLAWFSLFPSVKRVRLVGMLPHLERLVCQNQEFLKSLAEMCPEMESFNGTDLGEYRIL